MILRVGFILAMLIVVVTPGLASADCRTSLGGQYIYAHTSTRPNGNAVANLTVFSVSGPAQTFSAYAIINERNVGIYQVDLTGSFGWLNGCWLWWGAAAWIGYVADDGSSIGFVVVTPNHQSAGTAFRAAR